MLFDVVGDQVRYGEVIHSRRAFGITARKLLLAGKAMKPPLDRSGVWEKGFLLDH